VIKSQITEEITQVGGRPFKVIIGKTARQADGAVWLQYGDTVLHVAVVSSHERREGMDFLPLTCDYREKFWGAGKIPGGFFKREGRPHENEILNARMIDRPIRPLFPDGYAYETQVMAVVWATDGENDASILGPTATSLALCISDIPMTEAIASIRVGLVDGEYVVNPTFAQQEESRLDLIVVGSATEITMVEGHSDELDNQELIDALFFGHEEIKKIVAFQQAIIDKIGKPTREYTVPEKDVELTDAVTKSVGDKIVNIAGITDKSERNSARKELVDELIEEFEAAEEDERISTIKGQVKEMLKAQVREAILDKNLRMDGRCNVDIRAIECEVGLLPRSHGSALFTRGQTQSLGTATLGTKDDEQRIDTLDNNDFQRYMLHYNFPPYCTGEVKRSFGVSRREVGHGKLGERAIEAVLPEWDDFPYTVRVTSDILESNGSSSMASVCAGSLALMDAGVPLKKPVAGIAMGLIKEDERYQILTDILGDEDHLGDMDFKVAGTRDGITAFQMDIKIAGISAELMAEALGQARDARLHILDIMDKTISEGRSDVSKFAPKFITVKIPIDKIGALIGPGGKNIRQIIADTGATIDVDDTGTVRIGAMDGEAGDAARKRVEESTATPEEGKVYEGKIKKIMDFGAFIEIMPGIEGLMHISEVEIGRINSVSDHFKVGDSIKVKLIRADNNGKLSLSRRVLLLEEKGMKDTRPSKPPPRRAPDRRPPPRRRG